VRRRALRQRAQAARGRRGAGRKRTPLRVRSQAPGARSLGELAPERGSPCAAGAASGSLALPYRRRSARQLRNIQECTIRAADRARRSRSQLVGAARVRS